MSTVRQFPNGMNQTARPIAHDGAALNITEICVPKSVGGRVVFNHPAMPHTMPPDVCVLLTGWGGLGGTGIIDSLHNAPGGVRVVCADAKDKLILKHRADAFRLLPHGDDPAYVNALLDVCESEGVDVVMPGSGPEILTISKNKEYISGRVAVALDAYHTIRPLLNKADAYEALQNVIPVPTFARASSVSRLRRCLEKVGYPDGPACARPASYTDSGGSRGFHVLRGETDISAYVESVSAVGSLDMLVSEYLPGPEYSVYVLADGGSVLHCVPVLRKRMIGPRTFGAETVPPNSEITDICSRIVECLGLSHNVNIQLRRSADGSLKLVEVNPRMGGTIVLPTAAGVNLPYMGVRLALGKPVELDVPYRVISMERYAREVFVEDGHMFEMDGSRVDSNNLGGEVD